jgi:CPA2 family monovalent cation:H+ antiporter-2
MPDAHDFLANLALVLSVAALTSLVFQRLRQPVVFGYLVAGMIIGPHIPVPLVADQEMVRTLAELGVILLMFSIGLEFSIRRLLQVGGPTGIAAITETSVMMGLGYLAGRLLGLSEVESIFLAAIVAISSTTIIVKAFAENGVRGRVADIVLGILIVEDLIAILLIAILTAVGEGEGLSAREIVGTTLRLVLFLAGLIGVGMFIVPRLIRAAVRSERAETILVSAVGVCFAASLLALSLGYSVALGAFIAGALVAESGQAKAVEHLVSPVRDLFVAIFFVAVGMLLDPAVLVEYWWIVAALVVIVIGGKVIAVSSGVFLTGEGLRPAVQAGMSLAQIGEFSFIIASVGLATGTTGDFLYPVAVAVSAITTLTTPFLIRQAPQVARRIDAGLPRALQTFSALYGSWIEQLRESRQRTGVRSRTRKLVRVIAIDTVLLAVLFIGVSVEFPRLVRLLDESAGLSLDAARVVVFVITAVVAAWPLITLVRTTHLLGLALAIQALPMPEEKKVDMARAPRRALEVTLQFGLLFVVVVMLMTVTQPFAPRIPGVAVVFAAGLMLVLAVWRSAKNLQGHAVAAGEVIAAALARRSNEGVQAKEADDAMQKMHTMLPGLGEPVAMTVAARSQADGRTLRELNMRGLTGATVLALLRGDEQFVSPRGDQRLEQGDVIAVAGTHDAVDGVRSMVNPSAETGSRKQETAED